MRKLKFRVRSYDKMQYPDWGGDVFLRIDGRKYLCVDSGEFDEGLNVGFNEQKDAIIMQYIGLKDKNGKEIYEGDLLEHKFFDDDDAIIGFIKYEELGGDFNSGIGFSFRTLDDNKFNFDLDYVKVIGNVYENEGLLKKLYSDK